MPKSASIYERKGSLYIAASHKTQAGFWVSDDEVTMLVAPQPADLEYAVEAALIRSRNGVPTPPPSADLSTSLLVAAGVASWNTFAKTTKHVDVYQNENATKVTPHRNLGGRDGFEPMEDKAILLPLRAPGLSTAVIRALEIAQ